MSVEEDELERRVSILETRIRKLEKRNGLLAAILTPVSVTVFISLAAVFPNSARHSDTELNLGTFWSLAET